MKVILDNIRSAHNVGAILRTCDAMGIKEVYLCGITPDESNPKVKKTSLGAEENIKIHHTKDVLEAVSLLSPSQKLIGLELHNCAVPVNTFSATVNVTLVVGNEVSGLSDELIEKCDSLIYIPMKGIKESLNVSVAFGIAAFELTKGCK